MQQYRVVIMYQVKYRVSKAEHSLDMYTIISFARVYKGEIEQYTLISMRLQTTPVHGVAPHTCSPQLQVELVARWREVFVYQEEKARCGRSRVWWRYYIHYAVIVYMMLANPREGRAERARAAEQPRSRLYSAESHPAKIKHR